MNAISKSAIPGKLGEAQVSELVAQALPASDYRGKKVLLIIPDGTRTAPVGLMFKSIFAQIGEATKHLDILVALGTHPPMSEEAICGRLEISLAERRERHQQRAEQAAKRAERFRGAATLYRNGRATWLSVPLSGDQRGTRRAHHFRDCANNASPVPTRCSIRRVDTPRSRSRRRASALEVCPARQRTHSFPRCFAAEEPVQ